jgi:hypothetical protein
MGNWLEQRADEDRVFFEQAPTLWNDLKEDLKFCVGEFHKLYVPAGQEEIIFEACAGNDQNCVRIRGKGSNRRLEVRFDLQKLAVTWGDPTVAARQSTFALGINDARSVELRTGDTTVDVAQASRIILEKFLFPNGRRQPTPWPKS